MICAALITAALGIAMFFLVRSQRYTFRGSQIAFGLVFGGAIGNLIDRLWLGKVIDYLDIGIGVHRWPTFNVADIGVTLGVIYLAIALMISERESTAPPPISPSAPEADPSSPQTGQPDE